MGGLLNPEAYVTATRQCVAQANSWSLEELQLEVTITDSNDANAMYDSCFAVVGMYLLNIYFIIRLDLFSNFRYQTNNESYNILH